jgi:hypothetical protein
MEQQRTPLPTKTFRPQASPSHRRAPQQTPSAPVELDASQLVHVSGGTATPTQAPNSRW